MKIFDTGHKKTKGEKKVFSLNVYKSRMLLMKEFVVLVFGFMYLVLVDAMD